MNENKIQITHGIKRKYAAPFYRRQKKFSFFKIPFKFAALLNDKMNKWNTNQVDFTMGYDPKSGISALAIVHPLDYFNRRIGREIVQGRIKRMRGDFFKKPYKPVPRWIHVEA